jgi:hypothetical protein
MVSDPLRSPPSQFDSKLEGDDLWNVTVWDVMDTMGDTLCYVYTQASADTLDSCSDSLHLS